MWSDKTDSGGCSLPSGKYFTMDALALGLMSSLGDLAYTPEMCGQVYKIQCGDGPAVETIVAGQCLSGDCGVDLIRRTWNTVTKNATPGKAECSVTLSTTEPLTSASGPTCYLRPGSDVPRNLHYVNLGLMNLGGKKVSAVDVGGTAGSRSNGGWWAVNFNSGELKDTTPVTFTLSGQTVKFNLEDCVYTKEVQIFE